MIVRRVKSFIWRSSFGMLQSQEMTSLKLSRFSSSNSDMENLTNDIMKSVENEKYRQDGGRILKKESLEKFVEIYKTMSDYEKRNIYLSLFKTYGCNRELLQKQCESLANSYKDKNGISTLLRSERKLNQLLKPTYYTFLTQLGSLNDGVKFLIDMRKDTITEARRGEGPREEADAVLHLSEDIKEILSLWFSVGLLQLRRITWETSANILEKLAKHEAVHTVRNWMDLKHRLGPNRRCYSFFHESMPHEPIIVLHVALTQDISDNIKEILDYRETEKGYDPQEANCAIFYSITSTQKGLQGIELGAYLIQAVVDQLKSELPGLETFSSLSPIPGFRRWLLSGLNDGSLAMQLEDSDLGDLECVRSQYEDASENLNDYLKELVTDTRKLKNKKHDVHVRKLLTKLCAIYICKIKRRSYALDPVTNFHLKNGATVWRVNWMADESLSGMQQSCGLMVNYRYFLNKMADNSNEYITKQTIDMSEKVHRLLKDHLSSHL
ncbi:malonyl-CoA decarboxylase, mitochondrial-like [Styela clava]